MALQGLQLGNKLSLSASMNKPASLSFSSQTKLEAVSSSTQTGAIVGALVGAVVLMALLAAAAMMIRSGSGYTSSCSSMPFLICNCRFKAEQEDADEVGL